MNEPILREPMFVASMTNRTNAARTKKPAPEAEGLQNLDRIRFEPRLG